MICCCIDIACEQALLGLPDHRGRACSQASINNGKLNNKKSSLHFNQYWSWAKNTETNIELEFITIGLVILIVRMNENKFIYLQIVAYLWITMFLQIVKSVN